METRNIIKIHAGCGRRNWPGWYNIDGADYPHINSHDVYCAEFEDDSVSLIYSSHMIAYLDREEIKPLLACWYRVLKPDGVLRLATPDFKMMLQLYSEKRFPLESFLGPIYGKMDMAGSKDYIYHRTGYDFETLSELLTEAGFYNPHRYNWRNTDHSQYDDHSQAYLPKMQKNSGALISLNVQAYKNEQEKVNPGMCKTKTYRAWGSMIQRCCNHKHRRYKDWGGRGIIIDDRWKDFVNFFNDMGECPKWGSLDRIKNELGYYKNNCKWSDTKQQGNNRRTNRLIFYNGREMTLNKWSEEYGISSSTISERINRGWPLEKVFELKPTKKMLIKYEGKSQSALDWSREVGLDARTIRSRINNGWDVKDALTKPKQSNARYN